MGQLMFQPGLQRNVDRGARKWYVPAKTGQVATLFPWNPRDCWSLFIHRPGDVPDARLGCVLCQLYVVWYWHRRSGVEGAMAFHRESGGGCSLLLPPPHSWWMTGRTSGL